MMLSQWVKDHKGDVARIGTRRGSGFIFAGKVDSFTLYHIERYAGIKMHDRRIASIDPSTYGGYIVIIEGGECGNLDCKEDKKQAFEDLPVEYYQRVADSICASYAQDYKDALIKLHFAIHTKEINAAEASLYVCEQFFLGEQFAILMPHASGRQVLKLLEDRADELIDGVEERKRYNVRH